MERIDSPSSAKVRDLIFAFERQSSAIEQFEDYHGRPRAKSIGNALSYKLFRQANLEFHSILDIEKELVKIEAHLNYYEVYEKETHVAFQEQLFNVLTSIVSIDPDDQEGSFELKRKLIQETQKLATMLNSRLPFDGKNSYKGVRKTYTSLLRKEEAVVSTTSIKTQEHRAILSSHNSTLNKGYKSEESLISTKDSIDSSLRADDSSSVDLKYPEESSQAISPPPQKNIVDEEHTSYIPSVSKLKQFFSFKRETKPEVRVTSASYSGITRSQSLNLKTNKYTVIKKNKNIEIKKKEEAISENDEDTEKILGNEFTTTTLGKDLNSTMAIDQSIQPDSSEASLYIEPAKEITDYREVENKTTHNVSVSKLKSLFEERRNENNEGLALLTKQKQNEFYSDFNLPFNAMNLGAYRLKRTISGNYMNFTGLLRNVDVKKKTDISKSKSLSDLKIVNSGFEAKETNYDLSQEIDDDHDFEHVSINLEKDREINNNVVNNENKLVIENSFEKNETEEEKSEIVVSKKVEILRKSFENFDNSKSNFTQNDDDIKQILHKTIQPIPNTDSTSTEPVLKVPIQLKTGFTNISHFKETIGNVNKNESNIENNTSQVNVVSEEPLIKVPIQLRVGVDDSNHVIVENSEKEELLSEQAHKEHETIVLSNTVENLKQTFENISFTNRQLSEDNYTEVKHIIHRTIEPIPSTNGEEPLLKVPLQLRTGFSNITQVENVVETTNKSIINTTDSATDGNIVSGEPTLKVPVQLRKGTASQNDETATENAKATENTIESNQIIQHTIESVAAPGTVETLKQTFENIHGETEKDIKEVVNKTTELNQNTIKELEEPVLKVPVQLRIGVTKTSTLSEVSETIHGETEKDIKEVVNKTTELNQNTIKELEEPVLNVPVQLRIGVTNTSTLSEVSETIHGEAEKDIKDVANKTTEINQSTIKELEESVLKVPVQLRIGVTKTSTLSEVPETKSIEQNINDTQAGLQNTEQISSTTSSSIKSVLKVPVQLKASLATSQSEYGAENILSTEDFKATLNNGKPEKESIPEIALYSNGKDNTATMGRARIEEKTQSFMKILESPTAYSTLISSSSTSQSQQHISSSSTSKVSYSVKKTVQYTSPTHAFKQTVTSSSSSLPAQQIDHNLLEIPQEPVLYSSLSNSENSTQESTVTIEEIEDSEGVLDNSNNSVLVALPDEKDLIEEKPMSKINLNISQENILEEALKEADLLENVDEEFEKMLEESNK